ncbi:MAG: dioxygenase [Betaproteobacteria bacterium]|nr:MAG: dioxygenase [Betaproteobacteria bacterium]
MDALPSLFISHGSPMIALEPREAGAFLQRLGPAIDAAFGRPRAIVALSAHSLTREPVLIAGARHEAVYDFGGFPDELYTLRYDAPGAPALADDVQRLLANAGITAHRVDDGGLDHGIWTPLRYLYPDADVPVLPLAWVPSQSPAQQFVMGSGSITHNLRRVFAGGGRTPADAPEIPESAAFRRWFAEHAAAREWDTLFDYRRQAPHAADMHPTDEHLLPWYIAAGAGGREAVPLRLHASLTSGSLGMDTYAFGDTAARLNAALQ